MHLKQFLTRNNNVMQSLHGPRIQESRRETKSACTVSLQEQTQSGLNLCYRPICWVVNKEYLFHHRCIFLAAGLLVSQIEMP